MARAATKYDLIQSAEEQFAKMWKFVDSMTEEEQTAVFCFEDRDKNIRDILIHLYEWHQLLLQWVRSNQAGEARSFLPEPYNWKTYPEMNVGFRQKHQETPYTLAEELLRQSHADVLAMIEPFSNDELFSKKYFSWTGTTSLGSYCVSATASHYDWAMKKMKTHLKVFRMK